LKEKSTTAFIRTDSNRSKLWECQEENTIKVEYARKGKKRKANLKARLSTRWKLKTWEKGPKEREGVHSISGSPQQEQSSSIPIIQAEEKMG